MQRKQKIMTGKKGKLGPDRQCDEKRKLFHRTLRLWGSNRLNYTK